MQRELPTMASANYGGLTSLYDAGAFGQAVQQAKQTLQNAGGLALGRAMTLNEAQVRNRIFPDLHLAAKEPIMTRRLVQVFIADTYDSVPLDAALLYRGEPVFTDLNDQELFFDLDIKAMLAEHNKTRIGTPDKMAKDGAMLAPARVRDLKMVVVTIASF